MGQELKKTTAARRRSVVPTSAAEAYLKTAFNKDLDHIIELGTNDSVMLKRPIIMSMYRTASSMWTELA